MRPIKLPSTNKNFYTSGAIAFGIYFLFFFLFALYISAPKVETYDISTKNTVLELDVFLVENIKKDLRTKSTVQKKNEVQEVVKKSKSNTAKYTNNVKSLFANVKTTAKQTAPKEVNNVKSSTVNSRFRAKFEKERKSDVTVSKNLSSVKTSTRKMPTLSSVGKSDPYYSKIKEILYQRWNPLFSEDGLKALVEIRITTDGLFDFTFKKYSDNELFNSSLKKFLQIQRGVTFPKHNKGRIVALDVEFKKDVE